MTTYSVIARIAGKTFVEHPVRGDEAPVQMLTTPTKRSNIGHFTA